MAHGLMHRVLPYGLALALVAVAVHLAWEFTHGGVRSHHLLAQPDLPAISNGWGLLTVPLLGWLASRVATRRAAGDPRAAAPAVWAFIGALLVGIAVSSGFVLGLQSATSGIFFAALAAGLVFRTYRAEYAFGFVLGMLFVFGGVLPALVASVAAALSALAHFVIWPAGAFVFRKLRGVGPR